MQNQSNGSKKKTVLAPISPAKTTAARSVSPQRSDSPSHNNNPDDPATAGADPAHVRKNAKGGILVTQEELSAAFLMLDPEHTGQLTLASLKKRLGSLLPEMTAKDYRFLMNNKKEMSVEDLRELLVENEVSNYDPIFDAFRVFDPSGSGFIDEDKLRTAFVAFGLGELSDEELDVLKHAADLDGDGRIGLEDFRALVEGSAATRKSAVPFAKAVL